MAGGAVVQHDGTKKVLHGKKGKGTNNEAEYDGLILGLQYAVDHGASRVHVRGDSQLIIKQLQGQYKVKAANLRARFETALALLQQIPSRKLEWIPRAENAEPDAAANAALNS